MVHVQRTFTVNQPVDVVVDYLKDFGHAEQWDPGTVSCTRVGNGPVGVGSSWQNVSKVRGRETQLEYRLERLEPRRITFVGKNKTATSTDDITLAEASGGTQIRSTTRTSSFMASRNWPIRSCAGHSKGSVTRRCRS